MVKRRDDALERAAGVGDMGCVVGDVGIEQAVDVGIGIGLMMIGLLMTTRWR